ncbi:uncharacterized protein EV420DRAFT_356824 [Desarmillaria tabescens]|uniref:HMG box domain-containing protein n=1 Tax=Armillaria tabescens TaxID=1929756 RepID=A0AA39N5R4_ARMTA|nr:uncharacterized protein EV420DRAFT_356824 [Desarmillaria tabescens]KAK0458463.1 hypothetical protein EV420DRAFT_356824 [Desarmillaria tabescens]
MSQAHIPRPRNAFIFFRSHYLRLHKEEDNQNVISCAAGEAWHALSAEEKEPFRELAKKEKERYEEDYPGYSYSPGKGNGGGSGGARKRSGSTGESRSRRSITRKSSSSQSPTPSLTSSASSLSTPPPRTPSPSRAPSVPPSVPSSPVAAPRTIMRRPSGRTPVIPSSVAMSLRGSLSKPKRDVPVYKFPPIAPLPPLSTYDAAHDDWTPGYETSLTMPLNFDYDLQGCDIATSIDWNSLESPYMFGEELEVRSTSKDSGEKVVVSVSLKENDMDLSM